MIDTTAKDTLFTKARTHSKWLGKPVATDTLHALYDMMKFAPTSANCSPLRLVFLTTDAAKQRLKPHLAEGNVTKTMTAPVVAILAQDNAFYEHLPALYPHTDAKSWFVGNDALIAATAFRNSSLQAGYFILAARAVGLDCGPMSGFDGDGVNKEFFSGTTHSVNMLCNLGYGDAAALHPRSPRLSFADAARIL